jgi:hypothetical protein
MEFANVSEMQNLGIKYLLIPSSISGEMPDLYKLLASILNSSSQSPSGNRLFFVQVISGSWNLYELRSLTQTIGIGASVTVLQDGSASVLETQYSYYDISNVTTQLSLSGYTTYNISDFPAYYSYETIVPSPYMISLNANNWINFTGSTYTTYTVYWSNTNWQYKDIVWKDDSFVEGWLPLWNISQHETNGDIVSLSSPENQTWAHVLKEVSIDLNECNYFITRITDINGEVIFAGIVDGVQKYFTPYISMPGIHIFDISKLGANCTDIMIYLNPATRVQIDYIMFAK